MKVRNIILIIIGAALIMPAFQSCKKGPNDPAISLRSRTARLCGDWEVTKAKITEQNGANIDTYTYEDGKIIATYSSGSSYTGSYTWTISIDKKGTFKTEQTETYSGSTTTLKVDGNWYFNDANKDADVKAKEMLFLQNRTTTTSDGTTSSSYTYEGNIFKPYRIDQLKNKEVVLIYENIYTSTSTDKEIIEMTLTQVK